MGPPMDKLAMFSTTTSKAMEAAFDGKTIFLTGATGMLGTSLVVRVVLDTSIERLFVLVRGGSERFWSIVRQLLPLEMVHRLQTTKRITVLCGDITKRNFDLEEADIADLQATVNIFIHAASSINLRHKLPKVMENVVLPSIEAARLALSFEHLERFVYVSTAYVNAFLHFQTSEASQTSECMVEERIYPLRTDAPNRPASAELENLEQFGNTPEYSCLPHPFAYSYAKHLAERLLLERFSTAGLEQCLMIFRPSIFAPAEQEPFPHFEISNSTPGTGLLCGILASKPGRAYFTTNLRDPSKAAIDEVPIDIVVNRLLVHVAHGTDGCVHAVSGASGQLSFVDVFQAGAKLRPWWWGRPKLAWCNENVAARKECAISQMWKILGCSLAFCDERTQEIWESMDDSMRSDWPLLSSRQPGDMSVWKRRSPNAILMLREGMKKRYGKLGLFLARIISP